LPTNPISFCVYCGKGIVEERSTTACESCNAVRRIKSEMSTAEERPRCPWCDSTDTRPIFYGAPSSLMWQACARSGAVWGGCLVDGQEPQWSCGDCHRNWGSSREVESFYCNLCGNPSGKIWCPSCCAKNEESTRPLGEALKAISKEEAKHEAIETAFLLYVVGQILGHSVWARMRSDSPYDAHCD
jgi:hypothetical protein